MRTIEMIADVLGGASGDKLRAGCSDIAEIRLRAEKPLQLKYFSKEEFMGENVNIQLLHAVVNRLMDNSMYARENELRQGYFTGMDGCRIGVCGRLNTENGKVTGLAGVGSVCIRIAREVHGCADAICADLMRGGLRGILIASPPGLGKTTLLREIIRRISESGFNTAVADERNEIAACLEGVPQLNVGSRTDVLAGCPKSIAIPMLIRSAAPDMVAMDEIGSIEETETIMEAAKCGVAIAATAHAGSIDDLMGRKAIAPLIETGIFKYCALLGPERGRIKCLLEWEGGRFRHAERDTAICCSSFLRGSGPDYEQCTQAAF